ncbi:hypothetical protein C8R44DRAFT_751675 [Mycena epipterygia]|nr:hypothetical protein C8R44DRAFT_751675 [Mycena epipterygia]
MSKVCYIDVADPSLSTSLTFGFLRYTLIATKPPRRRDSSFDGDLLFPWQNSWVPQAELCAVLGDQRRLISIQLRHSCEHLRSIPTFDGCLIVSLARRTSHISLNVKSKSALWLTFCPATSLTAFQSLPLVLSLGLADLDLYSNCLYSPETRQSYSALDVY